MFVDVFLILQVVIIPFPMSESTSICSGIRRWILSSILCVLVYAVGKGQSDRYVFSAAGGVDTVRLSAQELVCYWNLGETFTEEFGSREGFDASTKRLTLGFEQGEGFIEDTLSVSSEPEFTIHLSGVTISPNPSDGLFYLHLSPSVFSRYSVCIRNASGRKVYENTSVTVSPLEIDLEGYPASVYFMEVLLSAPSPSPSPSPKDGVDRKVLKLIKI